MEMTLLVGCLKIYFFSQLARRVQQVLPMDESHRPGIPEKVVSKPVTSSAEDRQSHEQQLWKTRSR